MAIPYASLSRGDKLYTFANAAGSHVVTLCLTRMKQDFHVKMIPRTKLRLDPQVGSTILSSNLCDNVRLALLIKGSSPLDVLHVAVFPSGEVVLLGDWETYCAALHRGLTDIDVKRLPVSLWSQFIVSGVPHSDDHLMSVVGKKNIDIAN